mgnify:CR=1 FL=1|tara:strand:- start:2794 stop:4449 length:1656 start_codon:yes stop_codon:yes gene_type:complete
MNDELLYCPLGGAGEIGMNMSLYAFGKSENHKWIIVDVGITFADDTIPGVDLILPDTGFIEGRKENLLGIILTHAHEDHIGAISHVWPKLKCKIFATPFTATLVLEKFKERKIDVSNYLNIVQLGSSIDLQPFNIEFISLTHSTLEPNGLKINTPIGNILHTGDWKYDPEPLVGKNLNSQRLKEIGNEGVICMICDSTNVFNLGRTGSEGDVRRSLVKIIERLKKRIVITSFASNVARMETIFYCAKKTGRQIALVGRSMQKIFNAARKCGYLKDVIDPLDPRDIKNISRDKIIYLCTGSQGEPMGAMNRISNYIHPDVFLEAGDTVIFSSKIIPGNEKKLYNLHNKLVREGIEVISEENEFVHVSGHPNRDDLKDMYKWIKPNSIIPVHGEQRHMLEHINFAKEMQVPYPIKVENGDIVKLSGSAPEVFDKAPYGKIYLDGHIGVEEDAQSIKERKSLSSNGYLNVVIVIKNNGDIYGEPIITVKGLPIQEHNEFKYSLQHEIIQSSKTFSLNNRNQEENIKETIKILCRKYTKEKTGKKPLTNINFVRI